MSDKQLSDEDFRIWHSKEFVEWYWELILKQRTLPFCAKWPPFERDSVFNMFKSGFTIDEALRASVGWEGH